MSPVRTAPRQLTTADAGLRAQYLEEVLGVLYPTARRRRRAARPAGPAGRLPRGPRRAPATPARPARLAAGRGRGRAPVRRAAVLAGPAQAGGGDRGPAHRDVRRCCCATGCGSAASRPDTIDGYLRDALDTELSLSIHIGPARANRKPVLQLLTPDGSTVGFAKLGTGDADPAAGPRRDGRADRAVPARAAQRLSVPRVAAHRPVERHARCWCSPRCRCGCRAPSSAGERLIAAMREVAASCPPAPRPAGRQHVLDRVCAAACSR